MKTKAVRLHGEKDLRLETLELPRDGWKNDFFFELEPASGKPFVLISFGADGEEGGEGYDLDLYSTDAF